MRGGMAPRLALSVAVFALFAELVALGWYFARTGSLFYLDPGTTDELRLTADDDVAPPLTVHPYFGYAHPPNEIFSDERLELLERDGWGRRGGVESRLTSNNFGFISPHAYPLEKTGEHQFFIGIFGGSVGMWFCQVGAPRLVERLQEHPFFAGREIVPLCFSYSGYKQPQLMLVLAYFLSMGQVFDLVVNIDGFNDVALSALNDARGLDISMPSVQHVEGLINLVNKATLTPRKLESLSAVVQDRARLIDTAGAIQANRIAAIDFVLRSYYGWVRNRYEREVARFADLPSPPADDSLVRLLPAPAARDRGRLFEDIAAGWAQSSLLMKEMLDVRGATYVHVLQPNQYFSTRRFSEAEASIALTDKSPYKPHVEQGYPLLQVSARSVLRDRHVAFFDATGVLDREPAPMYLDDCCHYTVAGNRVLADFIARSVLASAGPWQSAPDPTSR